MASKRQMMFRLLTEEKVKLAAPLRQTRVSTRQSHWRPAGLAPGKSPFRPMVRMCLGLIVCLGLAAFAAVAGAQAEQAARRIALKSGESTDLRNFYVVQHCRSIMIGTPTLDVLEGPEELTVTLKEGVKLPSKCTVPVPGGTVVATAKEVKAPKEAKLTIRLKFKTKIGERQSSNSYIVSLFP